MVRSKCNYEVLTVNGKTQLTHAVGRHGAAIGFEHDFSSELDWFDSLDTGLDLLFNEDTFLPHNGDETRSIQCVHISERDLTQPVHCCKPAFPKAYQLSFVSLLGQSLFEVSSKSCSAFGMISRRIALHD